MTRKTTLEQTMACVALILMTGCAGLAERIATHLVAKDFKNVEQDFAVIEGELGLFRQCLRERGGACNGTARTPLLHSSQEGAQVARVVPGASKGLARQMASLPSDHPAQGAYAVLRDPVCQQATTLHDHLRGHPTSDELGVQVRSGKDASGATTSTIELDMKLEEIKGFHEKLLSSVSSSGWDHLERQCHLASPLTSAAGDRQALDQDCRTATFVRGYLAAYFRQGRFIEVDVQLSGLVQAIDKGATAITGDVDALRAEVEKLKGRVQDVEQDVVTALDADATALNAKIDALVQEVESDVEKRLGKGAAKVFQALDGMGSELEKATRRAVSAAERQATEELSDALTKIDALLDDATSQLEHIDQQIAGLDQKAVQEIDRGLDDVNTRLSNVFRVSEVGFVSRDTLFQAKIPSLEIILDPTARHFLGVEDLDTQQILTDKTDFAKLGVASDASGVGTGASIGAELVRVFLEAVFDAHEGLPGIAPANAPQLRATGLTLPEPFRLPLFRSPMGHVDGADLTAMAKINTSTATKAKVILERVIAGIGPFSLNNPALESFIVEILTTSIRKATEKASWCWYACNLNEAIAKAKADVAQDAKNELRQEEQKAKDAIARSEEKARSYLAGKAEQVRLRLRLRP